MTGWIKDVMGPDKTDLCEIGSTDGAGVVVEPQPIPAAPQVIQSAPTAFPQQAVAPQVFPAARQSTQEALIATPNLPTLLAGRRVSLNTKLNGSRKSRKLNFFERLKRQQLDEEIRQALLNQKRER